MDAAGFIQWLNRMKLQQTDAAILLGLSHRAISYYVSGERRIKLPVVLACEAYEFWPRLRASIPERLARGYRRAGSI